MPTNEYRMLADCLEHGWFNLLGLSGSRHAVTRDPATGDLVVTYRPITDQSGCP